MKPTVAISASVICMDWFRLAEQFQILAAGGVDRLHIDIMDGKMAQDFGLPLPLLRQIRTGFGFKFDYHIMCERPEPLFGMLPARAGDSVCFHLQQSESPLRNFVRVERLGFLRGFSIGSGVPLRDYCHWLRFIDQVTVVAVPPGSIGALGDPAAAERVAELAHYRRQNGNHFQIVADGNVSPTRATELVAAGADVLVGGSSGLFRKSILLPTALKELQASVQRGLSGENSHAVSPPLEKRAS